MRARAEAPKELSPLCIRGFGFGVHPRFRVWGTGFLPAVQAGGFSRGEAAHVAFPIDSCSRRQGGELVTSTLQSVALSRETLNPKLDAGKEQEAGSGFDDKREAVEMQARRR